MKEERTQNSGGLVLGVKEKEVVGSLVESRNQATVEDTWEGLKEWCGTIFTIIIVSFYLKRGSKKSEVREDTELK